MTDTVLTAAERGDLANRMLPVAGRLACIAHGDGDARDVAHALDPLNRAELVAVIVNLAAMVDPDQPLADLLGHVTWDENGMATETPRYGRLTPRSLVPPKAITPSGSSQLLDEEHRVTALALSRRGFGPLAISSRVGVHERTVNKWLSNAGLVRSGAKSTGPHPKAVPA